VAVTVLVLEAASVGGLGPPGFDGDCLGWFPTFN
jgi:hypothetical protein